MIHFDDAFLEDVGLGKLPANLKAAMLQHAYDTLELRVGTALAAQMSDDQLDEFEKFIDNNDDAGAFSWLSTNMPNYKDVVNSKTEELKAEIRGAAADILKDEGIESELTGRSATRSARPPVSFPS